ncbi:MAG TPA: DUF4129 domain-containing protein [Acidobacteriaceae bacterium]|nr:DUF4129 domain-containing protein [Acidobacteriaceae bacterium]
MRASAGLMALLCITATVRGQRTQSVPAMQRRSVDEYRQHLQRLQVVVGNCSAQKSAAACDPAQVGPDDEVMTTSGARQVHYEWLRGWLGDAAKGHTAARGHTADAELIGARLNEALARVGADVRTAPRETAPVDPVRANLDAVLAMHRFQRVQQEPNLLQRGVAAVFNWIIDRLSGVAAFGGRNPWIARMMEWTAITIPCVLLAWWAIVRMRRQKTIQPEERQIERMAPSSREWQRWLQESEAFAQQRRWREAVHHVYWAAISRMEAQGLWPVDSARTPREYVALLRPGHALKDDLIGLTRSFERIWYGNRRAGEEQYREARAWMEKLVPR